MISQVGVGISVAQTQLKSSSQTDNAKTEYHRIIQNSWYLNNIGQVEIFDLNPMQTYRLQALKGQDVQLLSPLKSPILGRKIKVAVLDTGVDVKHPYLVDRIARNSSECKILDQYKSCLIKQEKDFKICSEKSESKISECREISKIGSEACFQKYMIAGENGSDADENGYPADCHGWSLNTDKNTPQNIIGTPDFNDEIGHGTHVAGLIAAMSEQIEIIPVQVINMAPNQPVKPFSIDISPSEDSGRGGIKNPSSLAERVARGIIYAINAQADVINLSIGWPEGVDSQVMKDAIAEAQARGIIVVAAAGNDSTQALLRPCQYAGVICVGASRPDGAMAYFSNFGYGVDIAAPGTSIASVIPMNRRSIRIPGFEGMDILSGTSQAAPIVAGVIADMLSRGIPSQEIYPRLILGARSIQKGLPIIVGPIQGEGVKVTPQSYYERYVLSGLIDQKRSMSVQEQPLILNADKEIHAIDWDRKSSELKFQFKLKNFWQAVNEADVSLEIQSKSKLSIYPQVGGYTILPLDGDDGVWDMGEERIVEVDLQIVDQVDASLSKLPSDLTFVVKSFVSNKLNMTFETRAEVFFRFTKESTGADFTAIPIIGKIEQGMKLFLVDEVYDHKQNAKDYIAFRNNDDSVDVALLRYGDKAYTVEKTNRIKMSGDLKKRRLQQRIRMDLNFDGISEYILVFLEFKEGKAETGTGDYTLNFYIFDQNMKLRQKVSFYDERVLMPLQYYWLKVGSVLRPAWVGEGLPVIKKWDITDLWQTDIDAVPNKGQPEIQLYYLDESFNLQTIESGSTELKIVDVIQPSLQQVKTGVLPVLVSDNLGTEIKISSINKFSIGYIQNLKLTHLKPIENVSAAKNYRNLIDTRVDRVLNLSTSDDEFRGTFWFGFEAHSKQRVTMIDFKNNKIYDRILQAQNSIFDNPLRTRSAYIGQKNAGVFMITNTEIEFHDFKSGAAVQTSLNKYTFLGDDLTVDLQFPLTISSRASKEKYPALFTTEGSGLNRGVKMMIPVIEKSDQSPKALREIISPARAHMQAPKGCRPQDAPVFLAESGYSMDYYCGDRILRLNLSF